MFCLSISLTFCESGHGKCWKLIPVIMNMAGKRRRFNLDEVLCMIEDEESLQRADIHIHPPPVDYATDEDSGEEDGDVRVDNLPGRQLTANASATIINAEGRNVIEDDQLMDDQENTEIQNDPDGSSSSDTDSYELPDDIQGPTRAKRPNIRIVMREPPGRRRQTRAEKPKRKWRKKKDIPQQQSNKFVWRVQNPDTSELPQSPEELFELFFDDDVISMIVEHSVSYAGFKGNHAYEVTADEIRVFIAVLLVSGYSTVPRRKMFWSNDPDLTNAAIVAAMTRDRFDQIMKYLHVSDNTNLNAEDKFSKVRPLLSMMNERFLKYFLRERDLSIDESMIPYYGRHGCKQFIRGKPIRFGYKMWALTTKLGYVLQFEPYQGARGRQAQDTLNLGMGGAVVIDLLAELNADNAYHLTFDNLFTSLRLVDELSSRGISCTGTVRSNRIEDCPVMPVNEMQKTPRGTYDYAFDDNKGLIVIRWNDNNIVNVVSNRYGVAPLQSSSRWSKSDRQRIRIPQPHAISVYNQCMGGVDRMDQNVGLYRVGIRSKKWWWPIFAYVVDMAVQQAWHLYRATPSGRQNPLDLLGTRRAIVKAFLARGRPRNSRGRPRGRQISLSKRVQDTVRYDGNRHYPSKSTQRYCAHCNKHCTVKCVKCDVGLHVQCFEEFHTQL